MNKHLNINHKTGVFTGGMFFSAACLLTGLILCGCGQKSTSPEVEKKPLEIISVDDSVSQKGDLETIKKRGFLRILTPWMTEGYLPRDNYPPDYERELAAKFARTLGVGATLVSVGKFEDLIPSLLAGKGDIIAANLTIMGSRKKQIAFSLPLGYSREQIVTRAGDNSLKRLADLKGRTIAVQDQTSFAETAKNLRKQCPGLRVRTLPGHLTTDEILDKVIAEKIDLTLLDSNLLDVLLNYRNDIKTVLDVTKERGLAWGLRLDNPRLLEKLNRFLTNEQLMRRHKEVYLEDLPGIKKRKTLRVLTSNTAATYFQWRGKLMGFEYEMAKRFADQQGLKLKIIVAPGHADMIPMLLKGRADIIAAALTPTRQRLAQNIAFSTPYIYASQMVVTCASDNRIKSVKDLAGRTVVVRRSSSYWQTLENLKSGGIKFKLQAAPEKMETEEIISKVAEREYDLTVVDSHILDIERVWIDVKGVFAVGTPEPCCWVVRAGDKQLLSALNAFWKKEYRGLFYNIILKKYFRIKPKIAKTVRKEGPVSSGKFSSYDDIVKHFAVVYDFEWRLNIAQMYEESRFNPKARSSSGAEGLFQVLPSTAREMGFKQNLEQPSVGIHVGMKYLNFLRGYFEPEINADERIWFALASYNAGMGHVDDARRLARQLGLDPNVWFDNVEKAMLLLSKPQYARQARHGYVRGNQTVNYVREIRDRHDAYLQVTGN
ncbi:transporter substrate-binding domain-containing protein [Verrucomicrobiota bacterium]